MTKEPIDCGFRSYPYTPPEKTMDNKLTGFDSLTSNTALPDGNWRLDRSLGYYIEDPQLVKQVDAFYEKYGKLLKHFKWDGKKLTATRGFIHDFASVPRPLWAFLSPTDIKRPAVTHDLWYENLKALWWEGIITHAEWLKYRKLADLIFREAMAYTEPRIDRVRRAKAYRAVRTFGWYDRAMQRELRRANGRQPLQKKRGRRR